MADEKEVEVKESFWTRIPAGLRRYLFFCLVVGTAMVYANQMGFFPTYGIFAGENSIHSGYRGGFYGGGYGIHGK